MASSETIRPALLLRDTMKSMRAMAAYMDSLAEQASFAGRSEAVRLWQNAAANKRHEAEQVERAAQGRSVISEAPNTNPVLALLARHGRLGRS
ncbi:hypothetical protein [Asaia prunellae]|uniref:hypothetical protein n=1 Tax=Asaia prunellae TaxID=610245 RepID=UPI00046F5CC4|nr:hypothetical protein [Asaia prunellae]